METPFTVSIRTVEGDIDLGLMPEMELQVVGYRKPPWWKPWQKPQPIMEYGPSETTFRAIASIPAGTVIRGAVISQPNPVLPVGDERSE